MLDSGVADVAMSRMGLPPPSVRQTVICKWGQLKSAHRSLLPSQQPSISVALLRFGFNVRNQNEYVVRLDNKVTDSQNPIFYQ